MFNRCVKSVFYRIMIDFFHFLCSKGQRGATYDVFLNFAVSPTNLARVSPRGKEGGGEGGRGASSALCLSPSFLVSPGESFY